MKVEYAYASKHFNFYFLIYTEIEVKQPRIHMYTNARIYMDAKKHLILSCWIIIYGTGYFYSDIYNYKIITL